ncbi:glycosyltransferase family 4 protein [Paragemmobacter ruber]|uniref:Glycosyltransferase n=1 Tax=Paragemmobacter ruber TaxID=1985673 RepID=A0ABW9Y3A9_9RHOB|nr:glycosyltransferase family 4 protein [Rhodobacter ruber]NBE06626.1 glycosyltransferase [Rhodobacter ruber]
MPSKPFAAFAVPGALTTQTGGSFYDRRLVESLMALGHGITVVTLPEGFPQPDEGAMQTAVAQLQDLPADTPVIIDGLAFGALPTDAVARIAAPIVALVHHPLALETALEASVATALRRREADNLALARHVIVPSPHTKAVLVAEYRVPEEKITVLVPGLDRVTVAVQEKATPPLILSVGLLHPRKGHDVLIDALARLPDLNWQAVIAGTPWDAGYVAQLERQIAEWGLTERVRLAQGIGMAERDQLYARASVFALATRYEGYGIVFAEALAQGLPIVSCRTGAVPDTVPRGAGLLVAADDAGAFAGALRSLLSDEARRATMAAAARRAGEALPGWDDVARRAVAVLRKPEMAA